MAFSLKKTTIFAIFRHFFLFLHVFQAKNHVFPISSPPSEAKKQHILQFAVKKEHKISNNLYKKTRKSVKISKNGHFPVPFPKPFFTQFLIHFYVKISKKHIKIAYFSPFCSKTPLFIILLGATSPTFTFCIKKRRFSSKIAQNQAFIF